MNREQVSEFEPFCLAHFSVWQGVSEVPGENRLIRRTVDTLQLGDKIALQQVRGVLLISNATTTTHQKRVTEV